MEASVENSVKLAFRHHNSVFSVHTLSIAILQFCLENEVENIGARFTLKFKGVPLWENKRLLLKYQTLTVCNFAHLGV